jgi:tetratricopeptide (TPR) repeat protein
MKTRTVNHDHHPLYLEYDRALNEWKQAEKLWFRVVNQRATPQEKFEFDKHLREADFLFSYLSLQQFLSADSYFLKTQKRYEKLANLERYAEARKWFKEAGNLIRKSDLVKKRKLLERARKQFLSLGDFSCAEFYAKKAQENYYDTYNHELKAVDNSTFFHASKPRVELVHAIATEEATKARVVVEEAKESGVTPSGEWRVLIESGYDLCIRPALPGLGKELHTTTIITPEGAFQLNDKLEYRRVLDPAELFMLRLKSYLAQAGKLVPGKSERKSIRTELGAAQLHALDLALISKGGRGLEEKSSAAAALASASPPPTPPKLSF